MSEHEKKKEMPGVREGGGVGYPGISKSKS